MIRSTGRHVPHDVASGPLADDDGPAYSVTGCSALPPPDVAAQDRPDREATDLKTAAETPDRFALGQNYPNPFNPSTTIVFALPESSAVELAVYDVAGRLVAPLISRTMPAGRHEVTWQADALPSGVYLYRMTAGDFVQVRHMLLLK